MDEPLEAGFDFAGRWFSRHELNLIRDVTRNFSALTVTELSNTLCELLEWKRPNGKLKWKECRCLLDRLQSGGIVSLPSLRKTSPRRPRRITTNDQSDPQTAVTGSAGDLVPLRLVLVKKSDRAMISLWNQFIDRYHYLRYRVPFGASLRYLVESERSPSRYLACLLFSSPAWKMAARDAWIGWDCQQRERSLQYIVSNSRFLILPWISVRGLASKILSLSARQVPGDWERLYGYRPLLLETLVDASRFRGICYRASNWIYLGKTQGRGRMDRRHELHGRSVKDIYVLPLCRDVRKRLQNTAPPNIVDLDWTQERV